VIFLIFLILDPPVNQACHEDKVECQSMAFLVDFDCPSFRALCVLTKIHTRRTNQCCEKNNPIKEEEKWLRTEETTTKLSTWLAT